MAAIFQQIVYATNRYPRPSTIWQKSQITDLSLKFYKTVRQQCQNDSILCLLTNQTIEALGVYFSRIQ